MAALRDLNSLKQWLLPMSSVITEICGNTALS